MRKFKPYQGIICRHSKNIDPWVKRAVTSFTQQRQRCYNPENNRFHTTGGKGIQVKYTIREYITWWLEQIATRKTWKSPVCGRIDHDWHYTFENVEVIERTENSNEAIDRLGPVRKRCVPISMAISNGMTLCFSSIGEASRITGIPRSLIHILLSGKIDPPSNFTFRYMRNNFSCNNLLD